MAVKSRAENTQPSIWHRALRVGNTVRESYKVALIAYLLLFLGLSSRYLIFGEVIAPTRQCLETGAATAEADRQHIENRKFSDCTDVYIPSILEHFKGARSGWLTLWTNQNELGLPVGQLGGLSPAYPPSWIIALFTHNPWRFITALSLFTCALAGIFVILFAGEIGLSPLSGLMAGGCLSASPLFMYWLTFPMFTAVTCWSTGALWSVTRLSRRADLIGWSALAFSVYSSLMTAYPQAVLLNTYILGGYGLYLLFRKSRLGALESVRFVATSASAVITGAALAFPLYVDVAHLAADSARVAPDPSFFLVVLPHITSLAKAVTFFVVSTVPELFGNPLKANYPFPYDGLSLTPLVVFFAAIALLVSFKRTWGWWLAIAVIVLFAFVPPLYLLGVKYLGLNLSRCSPLGAITLPLTLIVAYGADALLKRSKPGELSHAVWIAVASIFLVMAVGLGFGLACAVSVRWSTVLSMSVIAMCLLAQHRTTRPVLLIAALITVLVTISYPLMLRQDLQAIATTSSLVEKVRAHLPADSRFAVAAPGTAILAPNFNAELGLPSVHSYDSLSPKRYHKLIKDLGGAVATYGRLNSAISPDYNSTSFWMSNIGLMLSPTKLNHPNLTYVGEESGIRLYKVVSRMGESIQLAPRDISTRSDRFQMIDPRLLPHHAPTKLVDRGDVLEFQVTETGPSVLVLSQKFYSDWQARVFARSGWVTAETVAVNGVFQGVLLPEGTKKVRLEFRPWARFAWIAHVFWLLLLIAIASKSLLLKHRCRNDARWKPLLPELHLPATSASYPPADATRQS